MATKKDLDYTYSTIDKIFRLSIGENGDFSGAKYDGDFSMSLEEAQKRKHRFIADNLNICKGNKVLDMGCGWGPFIKFATRELGAECVGLTLSEAQAHACRDKGFNVHIKDCKTLKPEDFGCFDAIVSLGAFEHFCSIEEWKAGKRDQIYADFFKTVYDLLPAGGRFYLQTMTFGKNMIDFEDIDIRARKGTPANAMALLMREFPGSWLPYGAEMVEEAAAPYFKLISKSSGRLDYIETIKQWRERFISFQPKKYWLFLTTYLTSPALRKQVTVYRGSANLVCFELEVMDHFRFVFEKLK